ncbi:MAG: hypothetical protein BGO82_17065 [Devosia sp. 67-54]|uniref:hypothetical protein n=1 Tax=unclassified Devosia TaxID=196773 RepID=UPI000959D5AB|nr:MULTISPECIES: hypothetical protein [unclassified Devosia]MBN9304084.1 hypothetical protein [Devosia sp.]OJX17921.1 MAG: hypothetical protein BGO82_17065 [Devosia sp. 67-54]
MAEDRPSVETLYVGQAMANDVLFKLLLSVSTNLVHTSPEEREAESADLVRRTLSDYAAAAVFDDAVAGLEPGTYDRDAAHQMALDALDEALTTIRTRVLGMRE